VGGDLDQEDPGGGDAGGDLGYPGARHAELDAGGAAAAGEAAGVLEDPDDLGGGQQDGGVAAAGALGLGGQHLDPVAGSQALGHVAGVGLDGQLDLVGGLVGGEQELGGYEGLVADRCGEHAAGDGLAGGGLEVVAQGGGGQPDPYDHEVAVVEGGAGGQVAGGGVCGIMAGTCLVPTPPSFRRFRLERTNCLDCLICPESRVPKTLQGALVDRHFMRFVDL